MNKQRVTEVFENNEPNTPMSKEESMIFLNLLMTKEKDFLIDINEINKESKTYKHFKGLIESFLAQVFLKRLSTLTKLRITLGGLIVLIQYMNNPAIAVTYAYYLNSKLPEGTLVTLEEIGNVFPWGFFSKEQIEKMWDELKVKSTDALDECVCYGAADNLLDYVEFWEK